MVRLRRFRSSLHAEQAARFLRQGGGVCAVVGHHAHEVIGIPGLHGTGYDLVLLARSQRSAAETLLEEFGDTELELEPGWEEVEPDLTKLDPELALPDCPRCAEPLPLDAALETCPSCGVPVDVVDRIVERHGPEALEPCYEVDEEEFVSGLEAGTIDLPCASCGYPLGGLGATGRCPECGSLFDKRDIFDRLG